MKGRFYFICLLFAIKCEVYHTYVTVLDSENKDMRLKLVILKISNSYKVKMKSKRWWLKKGEKNIWPWVLTYNIHRKNKVFTKQGKKLFFLILSMVYWQYAEINLAGQVHKKYSKKYPGKLYTTKYLSKIK